MAYSRIHMFTGLFFCSILCFFVVQSSCEANTDIAHPDILELRAVDSTTDDPQIVDLYTEYRSSTCYDIHHVSAQIKRKKHKRQYADKCLELAKQLMKHEVLTHNRFVTPVKKSN